MIEVLTNTSSMRLHPDRNFDTIAARPFDPCANLAALELGAACALLEPAWAARLTEHLRARTDAASARGAAGLDVRETLYVDDAGCPQVTALRSWICADSSARLRVVLNGAAGPYLCRPLQMGADAVLEELHLQLDADLLPQAPTSTPRCVVAAAARSEAAWERFWASAAGLLGFSSPAVAREAMVYAPSERESAQLGAALRALSMTAQRRSDNALVVANYLAAHPAVAQVSYPGLPGDAANDSARRTLEHGFGPLVSFAVAGAETPCAPVARDSWCDAGSHNALRSTLVRFANGTCVLAAGIENPLDIVAMLERGVFAPPDSQVEPA